MSIHDSYLALAQLLSYPQEKEAMLESYDSIASHFRKCGFDSPAAPFAAFLCNSTLAVLQEDYVTNFDFNPKGSLYLGHHLHGDNLKKGAYLIGIRQEFGRYDFASEGNELPDHLVVLLSFLAHLAGRGEENFRRQFIAHQVLPGLTRMVASNPACRPPSWQALVDTAERLCSDDCKEASTC